MVGHCKVDQTEKGWFLQYIDRDPETIERQKVQPFKCYNNNTNSHLIYCTLHTYMLQLIFNLIVNY